MLAIFETEVAQNASAQLQLKNLINSLIKNKNQYLFKNSI